MPRSTQQQMTPEQMLAKRTAQAGGGLAAAAKSIATLDHHRMLKANQRRVNDAHRAMARAAGMEDLVSAEPDSEDGVGDQIIVTGDVYGRGPWDDEPSAPAATAVPGWLKTAAVATGGAMTGGAGAALLSLLMAGPAQQPSTQPVAPAQPPLVQRVPAEHAPIYVRPGGASIRVLPYQPR